MCTCSDIFMQCGDSVSPFELTQNLPPDAEPHLQFSRLTRCLQAQNDAYSGPSEAGISASGSGSLSDPQDPGLPQPRQASAYQPSRLGLPDNPASDPVDSSSGAHTSHENALFSNSLEQDGTAGGYPSSSQAEQPDDPVELQHEPRTPDTNPLFEPAGRDSLPVGASPELARPADSPPGSKQAVQPEHPVELQHTPQTPDTNPLFEPEGDDSLPANASPEPSHLAREHTDSSQAGQDGEGATPLHTPRSADVNPLYEAPGAVAHSGDAAAHAHPAPAAEDRGKQQSSTCLSKYESFCRTSFSWRWCLPHGCIHAILCSCEVMQQAKTLMPVLAAVLCMYMCSYLSTDRSVMPTCAMSALPTLTPCRISPAHIFPDIPLSMSQQRKPPREQDPNRLHQARLLACTADDSLHVLQAAQSGPGPWRAGWQMPKPPHRPP